MRAERVYRAALIQTGTAPAWSRQEDRENSIQVAETSPASQEVKDLAQMCRPHRTVMLEPPAEERM
jgi:hypothetical protein